MTQYFIKASIETADGKRPHSVSTLADSHSETYLEVVEFALKELVTKKWHTPWNQDKPHKVIIEVEPDAR